MLIMLENVEFENCDSYLVGRASSPYTQSAQCVGPHLAQGGGGVICDCELGT